MFNAETVDRSGFRVFTHQCCQCVMSDDSSTVESKTPWVLQTPLEFWFVGPIFQTDSRLFFEGYEMCPLFSGELECQCCYAVRVCGEYRVLVLVSACFKSENTNDIFRPISERD